MSVLSADNNIPTATPEESADEYNAADDMPEQKKIARPLMVCIRFYTESEADSTLFMHVSSHRLAGAKRRGNSVSIRVTIP